MDPNATLRTILTTTDPEDFVEACEALASWLDRGGFKPDISGAHYVPGTGTAWSLMSPTSDLFRTWTLVRWGLDGSVLTSWSL